MVNPSVSVIIPAYRAARTIRRAIDSVLAQTYPAPEIIVVDDGSPDDQAAVVAAYGDRVRLMRRPNGGAARARNDGIDRASGEFIAFLDADDYWEPDKLRQQMAVFARHPEVALVAGLSYHETPGQPRVTPTKPCNDFYDRPQMARGERAFRLATMTWTGMVILRLSALGAERFTSGLEPAEDRDLWVRLAAAHPVYLMSEPLATAVLTEGSLSRTKIDRDCGNMLAVVHKYRDLLGPAGTRRWEAKVFRSWAAGYLGNGKPAAAIRPALRRLRRDPLSAEAWWVLAKSLALAFVSGHPGHDKEESST